jgi:RNA polymerase sigma-70 factor (ECF subfamily)
VGARRPPGLRQASGTVATVERGPAVLTDAEDAREFRAVLAAARRGDQRAWDLLLRHLMGPLLGYLRLRGAPEPDDLVNEVLLRAARNLRRFEGDRDQFRSWIFTSAHHLLVDDRRRRRRRLEVVGLDHLGEAEPSGDEADGPLEAAWGDAHVQDLLGRLTADQRDVLLLRVVGEFSILEVAAIVGKEPNAVKQLQYRGMRTLRRLLAREPHAATDGEAAR